MNTTMRLALLATMLVMTSACTVESDVVDDEMDDMDDIEVGLDELASAPEASLVFGTESEPNNSYFAANLITKNGMKGKFPTPTASAPYDRDWFKWTIPTNAKHCFKLVNDGNAIMDISPTDGTSEYAEGVKSKCLSGLKDKKILIVVYAPQSGAQTYTLKITTP